MGPADPEVAREQAPESFRALLGKDILANAIHGSSDSEHVLKKVGDLFPEVEVTEDGKILGEEYLAVFVGDFTYSIFCNTLNNGKTHPTMVGHGQ